MAGFISFPSVLFMVVMSEGIIGVVLGEQWLEASRIFQVLGIGAVLQPVTSTVGWLFISTGHADRMFRWGLISAPLLILSFVVGLRWGAFGVAVCYTIMAFVLGPISFIYALRATSISFIDVLEYR